MINLVGVSVPRVLLPDLAERLVHAGFAETAAKLLGASAQGGGVVDLTPSECDHIHAVLDDPPAELEELCRALKQQRATNDIVTREEPEPGLVPIESSRPVYRD